MICCSIQNKNAEQILALLEKVEMAEIRLDLCDLTEEDIDRVFSCDLPLIATCRTAPGGSYSAAEHKIIAAVKAGARFADLEIEAPKSVCKRIGAACEEYGATLIRSYHNFEATPSLDELRAMADKCRHYDGEIVKIVTTARSEADVEAVESLYKFYTPESLVAFAMAPAGGQSAAPATTFPAAAEASAAAPSNAQSASPVATEASDAATFAALSHRTRIDCLRCGAPFSYAAMDDGQATAPGQLCYSQMYKEVYGDRQETDFGRIRIPASKSYAQRAILCATLAGGRSTLRGYSPCGDSEAALSLAESLGAKVEKAESADGMQTLTIDGLGVGTSSLRGGRTLKVGESGLLTRLMVPLACEIFDSPVEIEGERTLANRPLDRLPSVMNALGASVEGRPAPSADAVLVPLKVSGPLSRGKLNIDGSLSSQIVSGAIMALPLAERNSTLHVQNPASIPYIFMTMDMMRKFGVKTRTELMGDDGILEDNWDECTSMVVKIKENQRYKAADVDIEGDWSAAAVFMAAAAIFGRVRIDGLDTSSLQADISMLDLLLEAGASISQLDEPTGTICIHKAPLTAVKADLSNCPDLFPVLSVFCAFCQGRSQLRGLHRLVHKESNRAESIMNMLTNLGVKAEIKNDDLFIEGESLERRILSGRLLKGGDFTSGHDHRMVMALRLAALGADAPLNIDDIACVAKSFPEFNDLWEQSR